MGSYYSTYQALYLLQTNNMMHYFSRWVNVLILYRLKKSIPVEHLKLLCMKKENSNHDLPQNGGSLAISITVDEESLLRNLVEKLAHRRYDLGYLHQAMPEGWQAMETSSIEAYVSGTMDISHKDGNIDIAYTTCFSFTCIKIEGEENSLAWVNSLS